MDRRLRAPLGVLISLVALGCEARVSLGGRCADTSDCPAALVCRFGRCRAECTTANDCREPGAICIGELGRGVCSVPSVDTCANDCADGLECAGEVCAVPCDPMGNDCLAGSECGVIAGVDVCVESPSEDGGVPDAGTPQDVSGDAGMISPGPHRQLCLGQEHACSIRGDQVYCWGAGAAGQLGDGTDDDSGQTLPGCGGTCWSSNEYGQLGCDEPPDTTPHPTACEVVFPLDGP